MAHTATETGIAGPALAVPRTQPLWPVFAVAVLGLLVMSLPNLRDPMLRYDDFPALLADPSGFWAKTLHEGRWLNYIWHLREVVTPAWLNFAAYQALWAGFAASLAALAVGPQRSIWFACVLALLILVAPPATLISLWFNTLLPGLGLVALYAVLGCLLSQHIHRLLLPLFVVASFMAYTTYPLLMLAVCLAASRDRSMRDLLGLLALFVLSFAAAVLAVYTINLQVHGIFGVPLAEWRAATPAHDLAGLVSNLPLVATSLSDLMAKSSFGFAPAIWFHLAMLFCGTAVLLRHAPREAIYLHAGLWMGLALVVVQILKMGVVVPTRTYIFAWVFYAIVIVRAAQVLTARPGLPGRLARNFVLLIVASYALQTFQQYATHRAWQADTRALAELVTRTEGQVTFVGDVLALPSAHMAGVQNAQALPFRMQQLTHRSVVMCPDVSACADRSGSDAAQADGAVVTFSSDGITVSQE